MSETPLAIIRGEERTFGVAIVENGAPIDLTDFDISAEIGWRGKVRFRLTEGLVQKAVAWPGGVPTFEDFNDAAGAGLTILNIAPPPPDPGTDPAPQYSFKVIEAMSAEFPLGVVAHIRQIIVDPDEVTTIRGPHYFDVSTA